MLLALQHVAADHGLILVDTKYEFGKGHDGSILLIDEVKFHICLLSLSLSLSIDRLIDILLIPELVCRCILLTQVDIGSVSLMRNGFRMVWNLKMWIRSINLATNFSIFTFLLW